MKLTLKIFGWVGIVTGACAIIYSTDEYTFGDAIYSLLGGGLFLAWGILTLIYVKKS